MQYLVGQTSQSVDVVVCDDSGLPLVGLLAATFPPVVWSLNGPHADNTLTLSDLATITSPWASGGVKERGNGVYRLDLPDALFTTAGEVKIRGEASNKHLFAPWVDVTAGSKLAADGLDPVTVESGLNARQALAITTASAAGILAGADNGASTITIDAANNPGTTRINATVDADGNRTAVTLTPPA